MTEETKKISFGFSKLKKQSNLVKPVEVSKPQIDYVDSFDGVRGKFSYKGNVKCDEPVKKELVIPLIGTKTAFEVIRAKLEANNADNQNNQDGTCSGKVETNESREGVQKDELIKNEANKEVSIDDLAAKEILNDLQNNVTNEKSKNTMVIKQPSNKTVDEKEIPIDYENIPVVDFGLAMLRGMGWTPQTGIGKEQKVVQVVTPKLRPKGLGLGADKVVLQQTAHDPDLTISIKGYVKFVNGSHKGSYGQVEAMDDNNGRVIVKLALGGSVSVSEMLLVPVTKKEYEKNSKVLNPTKYENFKDVKESERKEKKIDVTSNKSEKSNRHRKEKYDRKQLHEKSEEETDDVDNVRKGRSSSSRSSSSERSDRRKKKKSRDRSRDRKYSKAKKKRKKRKKYSSEDDSYSSDSDRYKRERSRENSRQHRHKSSSRR